MTEALKTSEVDKLYNSLDLLTDDKQLTTLNIVSITTNLMQIVEKYPNTTGPMKKELVMHVLKRFVEDNTDGEDEVALLLLFINTFLPSVIDTIISLDKKELAIKIHNKIKKWFSCL